MSCTDNLVDLQYGRKVHGSNRHGPGISCSTKYCRLLSVRARIFHPLQHVSRSATAPAKRIPGPHARSGELRDGAIESPDQCGDACVLYLEQKVAHLKWHGQIRWISQGPLQLQIARAQGLASIARSKAAYSAIDSYALGGLKTGGVSANSTGRQTEL